MVGELQEKHCFRSGFIALVGRPSVGKSMLLNALCGQKVTIISPKPQTTRNVIRGVVHRVASQLVFLDTPGFTKARDRLASQLRKELCSAVREAEAVLYLIDLSRPPQPWHKEAIDSDVATEEQGLLALLREAMAKQSRPLVLAMNKADLLPDSNLRQKRSAEYRELLAQYFPEHSPCFEVSAKKQEGLEELLQFLSLKLPMGQALYDAEVYTDQEPQFRIQELIREQALPFCGRELPYALYVEVADLEHRDWEGQQSLWLRAFLQVERDSQKVILVGKGGKRIREIRKRSISAIRKEFGCPVQLDLQVKVDYKWRRKRR